MRTSAQRWAWTLTIVVAAFVAAACGGDDDSATAPSDTGGPTPTPFQTASPEEEAYLGRVENQLQASAEAAAGLNVARATAFDAAKPEEERREGGVEFAGDYAAFMAEREARLVAITAPGSIDALHQALIAAAVGTQELADRIEERVQEQPIADEVGFVALVEEFDGVTLVQRFRDACLGLQTRASELQIVVDLRCNE